MSVCPKCNSKVKPSASVCPKCKAILNAAEKPSGTLDAGQFLDQPSAPPPSSEPSDSTGTAATMDHSDESVSDSKNNGPDESRTIRLPEGMDPSVEDLGTLVDGHSGAVSAGSKGVSGSLGRLRRVWAEAIGSSGKDSKQSLRHERAEASASVFRRVATRKIIDANAEEGDGADYIIQDKLGEGGMGIVFSALQTAVNRIVAIKSIRSEKRDNDSTRRQFFYEAEITAGLDHPNIPPIYELGRTADGPIFYSMKLIKGTEWQAVISRKSKEENLEVFSKIADAVALAHSKSVIHRDLKPA
ncbi:MAG TPA: protein kinase, partial [Pirellula sp.]|nr:protein kinase [Pirellula sp.]